MIEELLSAARQGDGDAIRNLLVTTVGRPDCRLLPFPATPLPKSRSRALAFPALTVTTSAPPSSRTERTSSSTWRRTG